MPGRVRQKWRPPLLLVVGGALFAVLSLPLAGLAAMGLLTPRLEVGTAAAIVVAGVIGATSVMAFLLWRLLLRPISALAERARAVRAGGPAPDGPLPHYGTAEMSALGQSILDMTAALQDREATVRAFTDHVTHELKTPLAAIRGAAELLADEDGDDRLAQTILAASDRMERELSALRAIAAAREPSHRGTARLEDLAPGLAAEFPSLRLDVAGGDVPMPLSSEGLRIVLTQLLRNAAEQGAGEVRLDAAHDGQTARLDITDDGPGIAPGNRGRVFEPFFTTRRDEGGTGMGLAIVAALLRAHGATIRLAGAQRGAAFRIEF